MESRIFAKPWTLDRPPRRILAIRFQALGDTVITLPYLNDLKTTVPDTTIDFLTRKEVAAIPASTGLFRKVIAVGGGRNARLQFALLLLKLPFLMFQKYDVVLDLQNNKISRFVRMVLAAKAFAEFDRSSALSAGERTRRTIEAVGLGRNTLRTEGIRKSVLNIDKHLLPDASWNIILNPAGYCESRNWPLSHYVSFAKLWIEHVDPSTNFVLLLTKQHERKAQYLREEIGERCINLTGKADQVQAFNIISRCHLMVSEDSGLMHMAWVQGIPTVALFSSSRKDWSAPQGPKSLCLDSSDMECGPCQLEQCKFHDNRCLTRYSPAFVLQECLKLISLKCE